MIETSWNETDESISLIVVNFMLNKLDNYLYLLHTKIKKYSCGVNYELGRQNGLIRNNVDLTFLLLCPLINYLDHNFFTTKSQ